MKKKQPAGPDGDTAGSVDGGSSSTPGRTDVFGRRITRAAQSPVGPAGMLAENRLENLLNAPMGHNVSRSSTLSHHTCVCVTSDPVTECCRRSMAEARQRWRCGTRPR